MDIPFGNSPGAWNITSFQALEGLEDEKQTSLRNVLILDHAGQEAGKLLLDSALNVPYEKKKHKFVVLCETRITTRSIWRQGWGGTIDEHYEDVEGAADLRFVLATPEKPWSYLKVMMIHQSAGFTHRLAIGTIHKEAWKLHDPEREYIRLA